MTEVPPVLWRIYHFTSALRVFLSIPRIEFLGRSLCSFFATTEAPFAKSEQPIRPMVGLKKVLLSHQSGYSPVEWQEALKAPTSVLPERLAPKMAMVCAFDLRKEFCGHPRIM